MTRRSLGEARQLSFGAGCLICSWRSTSIISNTRNSSSVISASVIVSPMLFAGQKRSDALLRRQRAPSFREVLSRNSSVPYP